MKRILPALFLLCSTYYSVTSQSICFDPEQDSRFETASSAQDIAALDVDNDGLMDVVITCAACPVTYHKNLGNGLFQAPQFIADEGGDQLRLVDVDNDGDNDLVRFYAGTLKVNLNNGNNVFASGSSYSQSMNNSSEIRFDTGDLNNDGYADAVANDYTNDQLVVYWNNGTGTFTIGDVIPTLDKPSFTKVGDINNDGVNEILVAYRELTTLSVFSQSANNTFSVQELPDYVPYTGVPPLVDLVDFSNDGLPDLVVSAAALAIARNQISAGTFGAPYNIFNGVYSYSWMFGDWNNDGFIEPAFATETFGVVSTTLNNNGNGMLNSALKMNSSNGNSSKLAHADFDNDGIVDIVVACGFQNYFTFLKGWNNGRFGNTFLITGSNPNELAVGDIDNDGDQDLINSNDMFNASFSIQRNNGDGSFEDSFSINAPAGTSGFLLEDLNADGNLDIAASHFTGMAIMLGNGNSSFNAGINYPSIAMGGGGERVMTAGDINGDGWRDLMVVNLGTDSIAVHYGNALGQYSNYQTYFAQGYFKTIKSADLNNDGYDDVAVVGNDTDELLLFFGAASGLNGTSVVKAATGSPESLAFIDANEDGFMDIVVSCSNANKLNYYQGNGTTSFNDAVLFESPTGSNAGELAVGDINGDGHLDAVAAFYGHNAAGVYFGDGNGGFSSASSFPTDRRPLDLLLSDFNGDGAIDIATLNPGINNISVVLNNAAFISYTGELAFCDGGSVVLSVNNPGTYLWSSGQTSSSIEVSQAGNYYCEITNQAGNCTLVTSALTVEVFQVLNVSFNLNIDLICDTIEPFAISGGVPAGGLYSGPGMSGVFFDPSEVGAGTYEITYTYIDNGNCTNATLTDEIVVELCVGIEEESAPTVFAYPNPTAGILKFSDRVKNVEITDLTGRSAWRSSSVITELDMSILTDGFYLVSYTDWEGHHRVQRIEKLKN